MFWEISRVDHLEAKKTWNIYPSIFVFSDCFEVKKHGEPEYEIKFVIFEGWLTNNGPTSQKSGAKTCFFKFAYKKMIFTYEQSWYSESAWNSAPDRMFENSIWKNLKNGVRNFENLHKI